MTPSLFAWTATRRRLAGGLVLVLAVLTAVAGCAPRPRIRAVPAEAVVLAFGDSLTRGTGAAAGEDYPAVLARRSGWRVVNAGLPGELSAAGLRRLPGVLEEHQPVLVLLCHGGNDILAGENPAAVAANLREMIRLGRAAGADVVLIAVPEKGLLLSPAPFYAEVAREEGVPCVEDAVAAVLRRPSLKSDYIHPNAAGYARLADEVRAAVERAQR